MAKRENRLVPTLHEQRAIRNLKGISPAATPPESMPLSNALIDIAVAALDEVPALEEGRSVNLQRLSRLAENRRLLPQE